MRSRPYLQYIEDPIQYVLETTGLLDQKPQRAAHSPKEVEKLDRQLSAERSKEVAAATPTGVMEWNTTPMEEPACKKNTPHGKTSRQYNSRH